MFFSINKIVENFTSNENNFVVEDRMVERRGTRNLQA